jgi:hypothetical protein
LIPQVSSVLTGCDGLVVIVLKIEQVIVQMFHTTTLDSKYVELSISEMQ